MKHVNNEFVKCIESYAVHSYTSRPLNLTEMLPEIGTEGMISSTCLPYTGD